MSEQRLPTIVQVKGRRFCRMVHPTRTAHTFGLLPMSAVLNPAEYRAATAMERLFYT